MALIVLTSASGSPGVTSTATGLAFTWPRPVLLVDADPTGGSAVLAGVLRGRWAPRDTMVDLAVAAQTGAVASRLAEVVQVVPGTRVKLLSGVRSHVQARGLRALWGPLAATLRGLESTGQDVVVDAGRLGLEGSPGPLLEGADMTLLVTRTDLVSLSAARSWAQSLKDEMESAGAARSLGLLLIGEGEPYSAREVSKVLGLPVVARIAWEPDEVKVFSRGARAGKRFDEGALVRSLVATRSAIDSWVAASRVDLQQTRSGA